MTLLVLAYLGGVLTILSPCILPVLPFVFARAGQSFTRSGLPMLLGMAITFALVAMLVTVGVIGDFDPEKRSHRAIDAALAHAAAASSIVLDARWVPTPSLTGAAAVPRLEGYDSFWIAPGSPYESLDGALRAIRFARERDWPLVAT